MRCSVLVRILCCGVLAAPSVAFAQTTQPQPAPPATPAPATPPAASAPAQSAGVDATDSLFTEQPNQFEFGGRVSSMDGDEARFQRYGDFRSGVLLDAARFTREDPNGVWSLHGRADKIGWRDQRYAGQYERHGRFVISGSWDQIPQFYSIDTQTPYTANGATLVLDDAAQTAAQNGAGLNPYPPIALQFDLQERRDNGVFKATITPTTQLDLTAAFTTSRHVGELPWGASFGFSNDVEVALPYNSRADAFTTGAEWTNDRAMVRVGYEGSWFTNHDDELVWDSPLRLTDTTSAPGRGRMALWPSNSAQTLTTAGYAKLARRTQLTGAFSYGFWNNDEPLQPFTINPTLPQFALPRATAQADANILSTTLALVSRPIDNWSFNTRFRHYGYTNNTGHVAIPEFINYDTSVKTSSTGGPEPFAHSRTNLDFDATWTGLAPVALGLGYTHNGSSHDFRVFEDTGENVFRLTADATGTQWATFRAQYDYADRTGSGLNEDLLRQIGEQPALRHFDIANRSRQRFTGQVDIVPNDTWIFSANAGIGTENFDDSGFGLQETSFNVFGVSADMQLPSGWGAGASYTYENYDGLQRSRNANPGQEGDPNRDWTADSTENVDYFSIHIRPPRFGQNTEARFSYDYSFAEGSYFYTIVPGGPLTPPNQLPNVFNKLQQLHLDVRHRLSGRLAATFSYLYEPFDVYDFAFDPSVVNGIVQPSSLVMGYVYRPYTAHSVVFGLKYVWGGP